MLILAVFALLLVGVVMVYSASSVTAIRTGNPAFSDVIRQIVAIGLGVAAAIVIWRMPYEVWCIRFVYIVWIVSFVLLFLTAFAGIEEYGARRWVSIAGFRFQPSEFVKLALVLVSIRILLDWRSGTVETRAIAMQVVLFVLLPLGFLYLAQSDLGTTLICLVGILSVMWLGGVSPRIFAAILVCGALFMLFAVFGTDYRAGRMVYLDPWNDGEGGYGAGYNIIRSYYAFAEGGLFGVGLGNSHEKFEYLFASDSDYIFAVIGEELGMVGALVIIALFLIVLVCGFRIASGASDLIGTMIAGSFTTMLVFQAFLNIGFNIGVFPTTGKPLPFVSSGGSSVIASLMMVGFILSVSRAPSAYEKKRADLRVVSVGSGGRRG